MRVLPYSNLALCQQPTLSPDLLQGYPLATLLTAHIKEARAF